MKNEQMCTVLNDYFLSFFTKEDAENVSIPQQMFQGTENHKLLDISAVTIRLFQTRFDSIHLQKIAIRFDLDFPCKKKINVKVGKALVNYNF